MVATRSLPRGAVPGTGRVPGEVRAPAGRSRRRPWVALLLVMVLLSAVLGVVVVQRLGQRIPVLRAARTIEAGQVIRTEDFDVVEVAIDGSAQVVSAKDRDELVGLSAPERISVGSLVSPASFEPSVGLPAGTVVVGAVLAPGEVPTGELRAGDRVGLLATAGQAAVAGTSADEASDIGEATVYSVNGSHSSADGGAGGAQVSSTSTFVSLAVPRAMARRVAQAASSQRLRLIYLPPGAPR
jgi:hypothetical protein